jgi:hypothetical protein
MKTFKTVIITAILFIAPVVQRMNAQQPSAGVTLGATVGTQASVTAGIVGTQGNTTAYYALVTNFTGGSVASNIITVSNTPNTLSGSNYVSFNWLPVAGAISYDLLKLPSASIPSGTASIVLRAALASTVTNTTDQGGSLSSYTLAAPPANVFATINLNSRDYVTPTVEIVGQGSLTPGFAMNGKPTNAANVPTVTTNATATGVTLLAAAMVNGVYFHAPTGDVNDTTDTAAHIIAALPNCYVSGTTGTSFAFRLFNNSGGANTITVLGGTNVTVTGTATVAQNAVRSFIGVVTACTGTPAVTLYSTGSGAY